MLKKTSIRPTQTLIAVTLWLCVWLFLPFGQEDTLPAFHHVIKAGIHQWQNNQLFLDAGVSLARVAIGIILGAWLAVLACLVHLWGPVVANIILYPLDLMRFVPPIAVGPIAIMLFGIGDVPAIAIVAFGAFFPVYQSIRFGLTQIERDHMEIAYCFGANRWIKLRHIIFPGLIEYAMSGLKIGMGIGWFCVVAAEMLGASSGLGFRLQNMSLNLNSAGMWFYILIIGLIGLAMSTTFHLVYCWFCPWQRKREAML